MAESSIDLLHLLLFVIPGFVFVWSYRWLTKSKYPSDFEYFGKSVFFGLAIMLAVQLISGLEKFSTILKNPYAAALTLSIFSFMFAVIVYYIKLLINNLRLIKMKLKININCLVFVLLLLVVLTLIRVNFDNLPIVKDVLIGLLVSSIFYFFVVAFPICLQKGKIKRVFLEFYNRFKEGVLREVLVLAEFDGDTEEKIEEIKDPIKFKDFAQEPSQHTGQNNWHVVMNNIDKEEYRHSLKTIIVKLSELQREADFLTRMSGTTNEDLLKKFRNLDRSLQDGRYKEELDWNWGEDRMFTDSLYELLSGWSMIEGNYGDFIKKWVRKL
jgi:hypothetical protein